MEPFGKNEEEQEAAAPADDSGAKAADSPEEAAPQADALAKEPSVEADAPAEQAETVAEITQPVLDPKAAKEEIDGGILFLAAYLAIWVILFVFVWKVRGAHRQLQERVDSMERQLDVSLGTNRSDGSDSE